MLGGISLCCSGFGLAGTALTSSMNLDSAGTDRRPERRPRWSAGSTRRCRPGTSRLSTTLTVISLLAILGAVILLALPASNAYFRKPAAAVGPVDASIPYPPSGQPPYPQTGQPYRRQPPYPPTSRASRASSRRTRRPAGSGPSAVPAGTRAYPPRPAAAAAVRWPRRRRIRAAAATDPCRAAARRRPTARPAAR